jgi:O-antigen ligase
MTAATPFMPSRPAARRRRVPAVLVMVAVLLAYMSFLGKPDPESADLSPSRFTELAFLGLAFLGAVLLAHDRRTQAPCAPAVAMRAVTLAFALWAMVDSLAGPLALTGLAKSVELMMLVAIAHELVLVDRDLRPGEGGGMAGLMLGGILAVLALLVLSNFARSGTPLPMEHVEDWGSASDRPRLILGTNHPLASALFLAFGVVAALCTQGRWIWRGPVVLGLLWLLHLCDARGIEGGCMLGILVWIMRKIPRSPAGIVITWTIGGALLLAIVALLVDGNADALVVDAVGPDVLTLNGRIPLWSYILGEVPKHPLVGVGYYSTREFILNTFPFAGHAHNSAIEVLFGTGLVGAVLFALFLVLLLAGVLTTGNLLLAAITPIVLVEGSLDPILFTPGVGMFITLLVLEGAFLRQGRAWRREAARAQTAWRAMPRFADGRPG